VVDLLAPVPGERVLDLGCGDGPLTAKLADMGVDVVGIDSSAEQIDAAKALGVDARVMDGAQLTFENEFDAVFSNATLHWIRDPDAVIAGVHRALKPGGRFVAEMGGENCIGTIKRGLIAALDRRGLDGASRVPWYFPGPTEYGARLAAGGFTIEYIAHIDRPTRLPGTLGDWLGTFAGSFLLEVPEPERPKVIQEVANFARDTLQDDDGGWTLDYTRLRFRAVRA
jgi:SAM-dependent methyltransferase